jgi:hypothetical protein
MKTRREKNELPFWVMDSAAPAAIMDNLMDSQKAGCPQVPHNRLDKS